jgi:hypothetical protein
MTKVYSVMFSLIYECENEQRPCSRFFPEKPKKTFVHVTNEKKIKKSIQIPLFNLLYHSSANKYNTHNTIRTLGFR